MAYHKVPQDVEADDKLLGPFTFRQFVYLLVAAGLIAIAVLLFQLFPLLCLIPAPFILLFGTLALPLKKDQPMETYLAALVSYYLKPRTRLWNPGQRESTITITAPKTNPNEKRTRDISGEEATHRLSFLADIVDSGGHAIQNASFTSVREDLVAEANATTDMFENNRFDTIDTAIKKEETAKHNALIEKMRNAIKKNSVLSADDEDESVIKSHKTIGVPSVTPQSQPDTFKIPENYQTTAPAPAPTPAPVTVAPAPAPAPKAPVSTATPYIVEELQNFQQRANDAPERIRSMVEPEIPEYNHESEETEIIMPRSNPVENPVENYQSKSEPEPQSEPEPEPQSQSETPVIDNSTEDKHQIKSKTEGKEEGEVFISLH